MRYVLPRPAAGRVRWPVTLALGLTVQVFAARCSEAHNLHVTAMKQDALQNLQHWYLAQCNGDWEHSYGVKIETLDNPGWSLAIELTGTSLENAFVSKVSRGVVAGDLSDNQDWLVCEVKDKVFTGAGGPNTLDTLIGIFLAWAGTHA